MTSSELHLEIRSDPRLLKAVRGLVRGYLAGFGLPSDRTDEVVLAIDEACANSIRHSYAGSGQGMIELDSSSDARDIVFVLRDGGAPAPADCVRPQKPAAPDLGTLKPGGLGVQLIYAVFDEVEFCPGVAYGNCVTMRLRRPAVQPAGTPPKTEG